MSVFITLALNHQENKDTLQVRIFLNHWLFLAHHTGTMTIITSAESYHPLNPLNEELAMKFLAFYKHRRHL